MFSTHYFKNLHFQNSSLYKKKFQEHTTSILDCCIAKLFFKYFFGGRDDIFLVEFTIQKTINTIVFASTTLLISLVKKSIYNNSLSGITRISVH